MSQLYTVDVTHEDNQWVGIVRDLPGAHTYAGNLLALEENLQEVIGLVLDADPEDLYDLHLVYADQEFANASALLDKITEVTNDAASLEVAIVRNLFAHGASVRDLKLMTGRSSSWLLHVRNLPAGNAAAATSRADQFSQLLESV